MSHFYLVIARCLFPHRHGVSHALWLPRVRTVEGIDSHFLCRQRPRQNLTLLCLPFCFGTASLLAAVWSIQQIASQLSSSQARAKARHRDGLCHLPSLSVVFSQHVLQALPQQHGDGPEPRQASPPHRLPQTDQAGPWKAAKSTKGSRGRKERQAGRFSHPPSPPPPPSLPSSPLPPGRLEELETGSSVFFFVFWPSLPAVPVPRLLSHPQQMARTSQPAGQKKRTSSSHMIPKQARHGGGDGERGGGERRGERGGQHGGNRTRVVERVEGTRGLGGLRGPPFIRFSLFSVHPACARFGS